MTRKELVRKFIKSIREDLAAYSRFVKKGNLEAAKSTHSHLLAKIHLGIDLGLVPTVDYYGYLMRIINLN